jgi:hypothetical protein
VSGQQADCTHSSCTCAPIASPLPTFPLAAPLHRPQPSAAHPTLCSRNTQPQIPHTLETIWVRRSHLCSLRHMWRVQHNTLSHNSRTSAVRQPLATSTTHALREALDLHSEPSLPFSPLSVKQHSRKTHLRQSCSAVELPSTPAPPPKKQAAATTSAYAGQPTRGLG